MRDDNDIRSTRSHNLAHTEAKVREWLGLRASCRLSELPIHTRDDLIWLFFIHRHAPRSSLYQPGEPQDIVRRGSILFRDARLELRKQPAG